MTIKSNRWVLNLLVPVLLVAALTLVVRMLNERPVAELVGRWEIVSTFPETSKRMSVLELTKGTFINITDKGNLIAGRRGLDGIVARKLLSRQFGLTQNGSGAQWSIVMAGPRGNFVSMTNHEHNQFVIAARRGRKPSKEKHD